MGTYRDVEKAREQYRQALALLRSARRDYTAASVPMDPVDSGDPPVLTARQHDAVWAYGWAWWAYCGARAQWEQE